ncbi:MAG: LysR family transcriptional regulator [Myxococcales bacterium FL481]|nr:MAG: LysR family transcriptional regulator [Myxococcales bacterium FL481]
MSAAEGFEEFVTVVESGSVTGAADRLGLPRPTLSRRLARLEQRLGVRLLHRTTRRLKLTPHGERLYPKASRVVQVAREAQAEVQRLDGVPRGSLRVSVPDGLPSHVFAGWMSEFVRRYPEVSLEIVATAVHVDLVADGFDVALRGGEVEDPSLVRRSIGHGVRIAVASAAYLQRYGTPASLEDLASHRCIVGFHAGTTPEVRWPLITGATVPVTAFMATNDMYLRLALAKRDLGIVMVIDSVAAADLATGELVRVLPGVLGRREMLSLVYVDRTFLEPKVRAFIEFVSERINEVLVARKAGSDGR